MHCYTDLAHLCAGFTLNAIDRYSEQLLVELETSAETNLIKSLQAVNLQKSIVAVGVFSMFEAVLQDDLDCKYAFTEASRILAVQGENTLKEQFDDLCCAINVLKHGKGRSYDQLIARVSSLPFRLKKGDEAFFSEGDAAEVNTLIEVDSAFVMLCAEVIQNVSLVVKKFVQDLKSSDSTCRLVG